MFICTNGNACVIQCFILTILFDRRTILDTQNEHYLRTCLFNASHPEDKLCPVFRLRTIAEAANEDFGEIAVEVSTIRILKNVTLYTFMGYCNIKLLNSWAPRKSRWTRQLFCLSRVQPIVQAHPTLLMSMSILCSNMIMLLAPTNMNQYFLTYIHIIIMLVLCLKKIFHDSSIMCLLTAVALDK